MTSVNAWVGELEGRPELFVAVYGLKSKEEIPLRVDVLLYRLPQTKNGAQITLYKGDFQWDGCGAAICQRVLLGWESGETAVQISNVVLPAKPKTLPLPDVTVEDLEATMRKAGRGFWGKGVEDQLQDIPAPEAKLPCVECNANMLESRLKETPKGKACAYCALRIASQRAL